MHVKNRCGRKDPVLYPGGTPGGPPVYHPSGDGLVNHPGG